MVEADAGYSAVALIRTAAHPLETSADLDPLMDQIGDARFVLLGEATHVTSEYHLLRARLSKRLIADRLLVFSRTHPLDTLFHEVRGHRAIGVVYRPLEQWDGSYVPTALSRRYDSSINLEETRALHPLQVEADVHQPPELYPWGV
ncbi:MAG: hypothetical protein IPK19_37640 [Chloroflexi bacterium]|nr:hypothetical protein [Chloroflexota bacterium]